MKAIRIERDRAWQTKTLNPNVTCLVVRARAEGLRLPFIEAAEFRRQSRRWAVVAALVLGVLVDLWLHGWI